MKNLTDAGTDTLDANGELVEEKTELEPEGRKHQIQKWILNLTE